MQFLFFILSTIFLGFSSQAQLFNGPRDSIETAYYIEFASVKNQLDFLKQLQRSNYSPLRNDTTLFRQFQQLSESDSTLKQFKSTKKEIQSLYKNHRSDTLMNGIWQLESIDLFAFNNPCCSPPSSFHEAYFFGEHNNSFTGSQLAEVFGEHWRYNTSVEKLLIISTGYSFIMNDSGEASVSCIFRLKENL